MKKGSAVILAATLLLGCAVSVLSSLDRTGGVFNPDISDDESTLSSWESSVWTASSLPSEEASEAASTPSYTRTSAATDLLRMNILSRPAGGKPSAQTDSRIVYQSVSGRPSVGYYSPDSKNVVTCVYNPDDIGFCGEYAYEVFLNGRAVDQEELSGEIWVDSEPAAVWLDNDRVIIRGLAVYTLSTGAVTPFQWPEHVSNLGNYAVSPDRDRVAFVLNDKDGWIKIYVLTLSTGKWNRVFLTDLIDYECNSTEVAWDATGSLYVDTLGEDESGYQIFKIASDGRVTLYEDSAFLISEDDTYLRLGDIVMEDGDWADTNYFFLNPQTAEALYIPDSELTARGPGDEMAYYDPDAQAVILYNLKTKTVTDRYALGELVTGDNSLYSIRYAVDRYLITVYNSYKFYYQTYGLGKGETQG